MGRWFSPVSSTNKTEILLKMAFKHHKPQTMMRLFLKELLPFMTKNFSLKHLTLVNGELISDQILFSPNEHFYHIFM